MQYEVVRPFGGPDGSLLPGTVVDEAAFRPQNLRYLLSRRMVRLVEPTTVDRQPAMMAGNREQRRHAHG